MHRLYKDMITTEAEFIPKKARDAGKVAFIIDKTGVLAKYFNYKAQVCDVVGMIISDIINKRKEDPNEIGNEMRVAYVNACKHGHTLIYKFGSAVPSRLKQYFGEDDETFRPEIIFNTSKNQDRKEFMKVVKHIEDKDKYGGNGLYPQPETIMCILCEADDTNGVEKIIKDARERIPDFTRNFQVYVNDDY